MKKFLLFFILAVSAFAQSTRVVDTNNLPSWPVGSTNIPISVDSYGRVVSTGGGGGGGTPGGSNTQLQYNNAGSFGGTTGLTYASASDTFSLASAWTRSYTATTGSSPNINIDFTRAGNVYTASGASGTFIFSTTTTGTSTYLQIKAGGSDFTATLPTVWSVARGGTLSPSTLLVPANTNLYVYLNNINGRTEIQGEPVATSGTGAYALIDSPVFTTKITSPVFVSASADPADAGVVRLGNAELIEWENATPGTDFTLGVNASNQLASTAPILARSVPRITTIVSNAAPTVNTDNCDCVTITTLAAAITSMTTNLSGTPVNFDQLEYRIKDDGTARAITWGASFVSGNATLPTTTTLGKILRVWLEWDSVQTKWVCVGTGSDS